MSSISFAQQGSDSECHCFNDCSCFDDLCNNKCKHQIVSSADERSATSDSLAFERASPTHSYYSLDGYTTDDDSTRKLTDLREAGSSVPQSHKAIRLFPASDQINRQTQQVSEHILALGSHFYKFSEDLGRQDSRQVQLHRQHRHCSQLLSTLEDFLQGFEQETESNVYCGNWFAQLILLKEQLNDFDDDSELLLSRLNHKMENLFDYFAQEKSQLLNCSQSLANLEHLSQQLKFVDRQISSAELELDDIRDYIEVQVREQRDQIGEFVEVMSAIVRSVEATLVCNDIAQFDCFTGQHFLAQFSQALNRIQII